MLNEVEENPVHITYFARMNRLRFAFGYALRHLVVSTLVALLVAALVFLLLYPYPYAAMSGVAPVFVLLLFVDLVCGPLLTLVLANPKKSTRERWVDFGLVGLVQLAALIYGMHSLWLGRPAVLAFEYDRVVVLSANEVRVADLANAPAGLGKLPLWGQVHVAVRQPRNSAENFASIDQDLTGISPAMRPGWWLPWSQGGAEMARRAKPVAELLTYRPESAVVLQKAVADTGMKMPELRYLPLTTRKNKEWVVLLDASMNPVGYAPIDGF